MTSNQKTLPTNIHYINMKRPEQSHYLTAQTKLINSKKIIEKHIDSNIFSIVADKISNSNELREWLKEWGWEMEIFILNLRDGKSTLYYKLIAI